MGEQRVHASDAAVGEMTALMRALERPGGPKVLRVGVVRDGAVIDERFVDRRGAFEVGASERASFVLDAPGLPKRFRLFEHGRDGYRLHWQAGMDGRLTLDDRIATLSELEPFARAEGGGFSVRLEREARGKVRLGGTTFLFQLVERPRPQARPALPPGVGQGLVREVDWLTTIAGAASFLGHFMLVAVAYSDWVDPIVDSGVRAEQLIDAYAQVPRPPVELPSATAPAAAASDEAQPGTQAPKQSARSASGASHAGARAPTGPSGDHRSTSERVADIARELDALDVRTVAVLDGGGAATEDTLGGELPATLLDAAARSGSRRGVGDDLELSSGRSTTVVPGARDLTGATEEGAADPDARASDAGESRRVDGPRTDVKPTVKPGPGPQIKNAAAVVGRMRGAFRRCYEAGMLVQPEMQGAVSLFAKVGPNGEVLGVTGGGGPLAPIVPCLVGVVQTAQFDPPTGGTTTMVAIPIEFWHQ